MSATHEHATKPQNPAWKEVEEILNDPHRGPEGLVGRAFAVNNTANYKYEMPDEAPGDKLYVIGEVTRQPVMEYEVVARLFHPLAVETHNREERSYVLYKLKPTAPANEDGITVYDELQEVTMLNDGGLKEFLTGYDARPADTSKQVPKIPRQERPLATRGPIRPVSFDVDRRGDVFEDISRQLEAENILNWTGLQFATSKASKEKDEDGDERTVFTTRFWWIARETLLHKIGGKKDSDNVVVDFKPARKFVVHEYNEAGEPITTHLLGPDDKEQKNVPELPDFLNGWQGDDDWMSPIYIETADEPWPPIQPQMRSDLRRRLTDAGRALETVSREDRAATWLLSYADTISGSDPEADEERLDKLAEVAAGPEGRRRVVAVKAMIERYGIDRIYQVASVMRDDFMASAAELDLSTDITDTSGEIRTVGNSISWAVEGMADQYYFDARRDEAGEDRDGLEPGHALQASHNRAQLRMRDIVDQRIGSALLDATIHWQKDKPVVEGIHPITRQPAYGMKKELLFDPEPLEKTPKITRKQIKEVEETIYRAVKEERTVKLADLLKLGRLLRRGVGR